MADLPRRTLGRTGLEVTTLGFGAMELRGQPTGPEISDKDAGRLLNTGLDEGINFIDTSIDYGRSEELIGKFLAHQRSERPHGSQLRESRPPRRPRCGAFGVSAPATSGELRAGGPVPLTDASAFDEIGDAVSAWVGEYVPEPWRRAAAHGGREAATRPGPAGTQRESVR